MRSSKRLAVSVAIADRARVGSVPCRPRQPTARRTSDLRSCRWSSAIPERAWPSSPFPAPGCKPLRHRRKSASSQRRRAAPASPLTGLRSGLDLPAAAFAAQPPLPEPRRGSPYEAIRAPYRATCRQACSGRSTIASRWRDPEIEAPTIREEPRRFAGGTFRRCHAASTQALDPCRHVGHTFLRNRGSAARSRRVDGRTSLTTPVTTK